MEFPIMGRHGKGWIQVETDREERSEHTEETEKRHCESRETIVTSDEQDERLQLSTSENKSETRVRATPDTRHQSNTRQNARHEKRKKRKKGRTNEQRGIIRKQKKKKKRKPRGIT
jgi:hypothetical protein